MPRFVVLTHDHPHWHWDFMLEANGVLRTWRLDTDPLIPGPIVATPLPNHRLHYLEYEGPVSGQRGTVGRWDQGEYTLLADSPENLLVLLRGRRLLGEAQLVTATDGSVVFHFQSLPNESP